VSISAPLRIAMGGKKSELKIPRPSAYGHEKKNGARIAKSTSMEVIKNCFEKSECDIVREF
jgi:hypothetical protein